MAAYCKNCTRTDMFLHVDHNGLCDSCSPMVIMEIQQKGSLISDCMKLIDSSKNVDVQTTRYDFLIENLRALLRYEQKGIPTISPLPSFLLQEYDGKRDDIVLKNLAGAFQAANENTPITTAAKTKINRLGKVLLKLRDNKNKLKDPALAATLERGIVEAIHKTQLDGYLDAARKAEFKGQKKKALDQYYEALYFLRHDEIDDTMQHENISSIETKIVALGGDASGA